MYNVSIRFCTEVAKLFSLSFSLKRKIISYIARYRASRKDVTYLEDNRIIDLFFCRSEQAIDELDKAHGAAVWKTASNILCSRLDIEETVNDTYWGCWNAIPPNRPNPLVSFVCRIARNIAVSRVRAESAAKRNSGLALVLDEIDEFVPSGTDVQAEFEAKDLIRVINGFLSTLAYDDRYIFVRRYWYADSVKDIASSMGCGENRISVRLYRLREKLRVILEKEGIRI